MKYNVGDRVRIKNFDWFRNEGANIAVTFMMKYYGEVVTIKSVHKDFYRIKEDGRQYCWTDEMIECKVEGIEDRMKEMRKMCTISLTDSNYSDKVEVLLNDYEYIEENGKAYFVKKKKEYPKTYEECCKVLGYDDRETYCIFHTGADERLFESLYRLKVCRDAYWKIAGEEMGLGKPWEPPYGYEPIDTFCLQVYQDRITKVTDNTLNHCILTFPTPEMRDQFYENFSKEMENCKGLL